MNVKPSLSFVPALDLERPEFKFKHGYGERKTFALGVASENDRTFSWPSQGDEARKRRWCRK